MPETLKIRRKRGTLPRVRDSYTANPSGIDVPRRRREIEPETTDLPARFALLLRTLMTKKGWTSKDVSERLTKAGVDVGPRGVDVWLRGEGSPKFRDLEKIGRALLGKKDYRMILPRPRQ